MLNRKLKQIGVLSLTGIVLVLAALSQSCSEKTPTNAFDDLADSTLVGTLKTLNLAKPDTAFSGSIIVSSSSSPFLFLGSEDGKNVSVALRFFNLPESLVVTEAKLVWVADTIYTGTPTGTVSATVHEIKQDWELAKLRFEDTQNDFFEPAPAGNFDVPVQSVRDTFFVDIDPNLVNKWIGLQDSLRNGILIRPQGAFFVQRFLSLNATTNQPKLQLFHEDTTRTSPIETIASGDASIIEVVTPPASGSYYVGNGVEYKTLLKYDLSEIPKEATINRAQLVVNINSTHSYLSADDPFVIGVEAVLSELTDLDAGVDSLILNSKIRLITNSVAVLPSTSTLTINLNDLVQSWTSGQQANYGMLLETRSTGRDLYRMAIYSGELEPERAPKLEIQYSVPPTYKRHSDEANQ